eukprot:g273.t1
MSRRHEERQDHTNRDDRDTKYKRHRDSSDGRYDHSSSSRRRRRSRSRSRSRSRERRKSKASSERRTRRSNASRKRSRSRSRDRRNIKALEEEAYKTRAAAVRRMDDKAVALGEKSGIDRRSLDELTEEEKMMRLMGFSSLSSTKGKKVSSNHTTDAKGAVAVSQKRKYRQYMNRSGGFNRSLDKV